MTSPPPGPWVETWLSAPRFQTYLDEAGRDRSLGLRLYEWNVAMSAAVLHDLAHLEVGLRNVYDRTLSSGVVGGRHWTATPHVFFAPVIRRAADGSTYDANDKPRQQIRAAVRAAGGPAVAPGKVIAELTFGFWRYLSTRAHEAPLWMPYLRHGFVPSTARRDVDGPAGRLNDLRNRVAHHEPLLGTNLTDRRSDVVDLAGRISPDLAAYLNATSTWLAVAGQRPG